MCNVWFKLLETIVPIKYAWSIGRASHGHKRSILIRLIFYDGVMEIKGLVTAFENFKRKNPVILRMFIQITWKGISISISTPAVYIFMKSLINSRLFIEFGPWKLNTGCQLPLENRKGCWMRHIKPLFIRNITGCSAFRPNWILMDLVMFGLTS